jgi:hypothetical protein
MLMSWCAALQKGAANCTVFSTFSSFPVEQNSTLNQNPGIYMMQVIVETRLNKFNDDRVIILRIIIWHSVLWWRWYWPDRMVWPERSEPKIASPEYGLRYCLLT